jgi:hypothetical protein
MSSPLLSLRDNIFTRLRNLTAADQLADQLAKKNPNPETTEKSLKKKSALRKNHRDGKEEARREQERVTQNNNETPSPSSSP